MLCVNEAQERMLNIFHRFRFVFHDVSNEVSNFALNNHNLIDHIHIHVYFFVVDLFHS